MALPAIHSPGKEAGNVKDLYHPISDRRGSHILLTGRHCTVLWDPETGRFMGAGGKDREVIMGFFRTDSQLDEATVQRLGGVPGVGRSLASGCRPFALRKYDRYFATLNITSDCNLRCGYCYANGGHLHKYMSFSTAKKALEAILLC